MDCEKIGRLLAGLRLERGLTQSEAAAVLHVSPQAVSKWERGAGCPDVSLLGALAALYGVGVEQLLLGELAANELNGGNMKHVKFYVCPACGNLLWATGNGALSCCGRILSPEAAKPEDGAHRLSVEEIEDDYFVTLDHPMEKEHFISFFACVCADRVLVLKLYPEQGAQVRFPQMYGGTPYFYCSRDGLFRGDPKPFWPRRGSKAPFPASP